MATFLPFHPVSHHTALLNVASPHLASIYRDKPPLIAPQTEKASDRFVVPLTCLAALSVPCAIPRHRAFLLFCVCAFDHRAILSESVLCLRRKNRAPLPPNSQPVARASAEVRFHGERVHTFPWRVSRIRHPFWLCNGDSPGLWTAVVVCRGAPTAL